MTMAPSACSAPPGASAGVTRYETQWDEYSRLWAGDPYFRRFRYLGDEWGSEDWVRHNVDTFVAPYVEQGSTVLEIGPGGGRYTNHILGLCGGLVGVDVSSEMIRRLEARFQHRPNATFVQGDGRTLTGIEAESVDFACAFNVFVQLDLEDIYGYLLELKRVLKPGGSAAIQYAAISGEDGWEYFDRNRVSWSSDPGQRGRFTELTLATMDLLLDRAGLTRVRNQHVARDAVVVFTRSAEPTDASRADAATRRDFTFIDRYLDDLAQDVYHELPTVHHTAAAHETVTAMLAGLGIETALELGCGSGPTLDKLKELGVTTRGVSLGAEECGHPVVHEDMHFSGLPAGSADVVIARHIVEHSPMPLLLLLEMARLTKRYALVVVPCDEEIWVNWPNHYSVLSKPMWRKLFERARFDVLAEADGRLEPDSTEWRFLLEKNNHAAGAA